MQPTAFTPAFKPAYQPGASHFGARQPHLLAGKMTLAALFAALLGTGVGSSIGSYREVNHLTQLRLEELEKLQLEDKKTENRLAILAIQLDSTLPQPDKDKLLDQCGHLGRKDELQLDVTDPVATAECWRGALQAIQDPAALNLLRKEESLGRERDDRREGIMKKAIEPEKINLRGGLTGNLLGLFLGAVFAVIQDGLSKTWARRNPHRLRSYQEDE